MRRSLRILLIVCGAAVALLLAGALLGSWLASRAYRQVPEALDALESTTSGQVQAEQGPLQSGLLSSVGSTRLVQGDSALVARHVIHHGPIPWRRLDRAPARAVIETTFEVPKAPAPGGAEGGDALPEAAAGDDAVPVPSAAQSSGPHVVTVLALDGSMRMELSTPQLGLGVEMSEGAPVAPELMAGPVSGFVETGSEADYRADVAIGAFRTVFILAPLAGEGGRVQLDYTLVAGAPVGTARYAIESLALGGRDAADPASVFVLTNGAWSVESRIVDPPAPAPEDRLVYSNENAISFASLRAFDRTYTDATLLMDLEIDEAVRRDLDGREGQVLGIEPSAPSDLQLEALRQRLLDSAPVLEIEKLALRTKEGSLDLALRATTQPEAAGATPLARIEATGSLTISRDLLAFLGSAVLASLPESLVPEDVLEPASIDAWLRGWQERGYVAAADGDLVQTRLELRGGVLQLNGKRVAPGDLLPQTPPQP
jgi:hypothetical protein